jgi:SAM-dependent methyltransferase
VPEPAPRFAAATAGRRPAEAEQAAATGGGFETVEGAIEFWDERHRKYGALRSGGHVGLDESANEFFYLLRIGKLLELVGDLNSLGEPMFVLDAGCGKGRIAAAMASCGFRVDGIDTSEAAIEFSRQHYPGRYEVSRLADWRNLTPYDVVYCVDVLFHILDEDEWAASVRNLASLTRLGGKLILTDEYRDERRALGDYIVHRPHHAYRNLLESRGFGFVEFSPYRFRDNQVGFLSFRRES